MMTALFVALTSLLAGAVSAQSFNAAHAAKTQDNFGAERPVARVAPNISQETCWVVPASPEKVFPLLCPVLEYDWIPGWRAKLIHSVSGVAEPDCIFETRYQPFGRMTWICTYYQPASRIEYTSFAELGLLVRLRIALEPVGKDTRITWNRSWYALDDSGEKWIQAWDAKGYDKHMADAQAQMEHYLRTGSLKP